MDPTYPGIDRGQRKEEQERKQTKSRERGRRDKGSWISMEKEETKEEQT